VVPCYNEGENIPLILEAFAKVINRSDVELILVDNGSTDDSAQVLATLVPLYRFAHTVRVDVNIGYGFGILSGLRSASGTFLAWTHADMQTDPADVIKALDLIEQSEKTERTYVKGNRQQRPLADAFFTFGMSVFESIYLGVNLNDINAQPNLFHRSFFESWQDPPNDFALDLYAFYRARKDGLTVIRFPVLFTQRIHGHSHWNFGFKSKVRFIMRTLDFSFKLKKRLS